MELEWDEAKRLLNIEKHGLDFLDAVNVLKGNVLVKPARPAGQEIRQAIIGLLGGKLVTIITTQRGKNIRVISMRRARDDERAGYQTLYGR